MKHKILIAGQGLAGTVLALTLQSEGVEVWVADHAPSESSSLRAAGIINPVTGKRYAKSWGFDQFFPFAKSFYQQFETEAGHRLWHDLPIIRMLGSALESNEWQLRASREEFHGLMGHVDNAMDWSELVRDGFTYGLLHAAGRLDIGRFLEFARNRFKNNWLNQKIDYEDVAVLTQDFDKIIFCEGYRAAANPFFPNIPWQSAKGERAIFTLDSPREISQILKKQIMLAPLGENRYWAGANYYWEFDDETTTPEGLAWLKTEIETMLTSPYTIVNHQAGIRPVVKDRRPVLGWSRLNPAVGIFNGTGSKGSLLSPYWAAHLAGNIIHDSPIDPATNVQRFSAGESVNGI